jgi:hypothetical protein
MDEPIVHCHPLLGDRENFINRTGSLFPGCQFYKQLLDSHDETQAFLR